MKKPWHFYQGSVVAENLSNGTVTVTVPVSASSNNEVLVDYINETQHKHIVTDSHLRPSVGQKT